MGSWSGKTVTLKPIEFDGDTIVFTTKRLLVEDMQVLLKFYNAEKGVLSFGDSIEVCKVASNLFPKYITHVSGMFKEDGSAFNLEDFYSAANEFYFVALSGALFGALIEASTLKVISKNLLPPSPESSVALGGESQ